MSEPSAPEPVPVARLRAEHAEAIHEVVHDRGEWTVIVDPAQIVAVCRFLRDDARTQMVFPVDVCAIHWMDRPWEYEVVYHLYSFLLNERIRLKCRVGSAGRIASVTSVFPGADWHEREAYDLVGVRFDGHPDLRRILMPEDYDAHPLRRDFPVKGY